MTKPKDLKVEDGVKYRRDGNDIWSPRVWHVKKIVTTSPKYNYLINSGSMFQWASRHELRKLPRKKGYAITRAGRMGGVVGKEETR